jgi:DNA (cytosine-5)-methyltransferase 1
MRLLDLYCCAGGAGLGYHQAGFEVVGVDISPQPRYPFTFIQRNVLALDLKFIRTFDAIHASPPCQFATELRHAPNTKEHPNLIPETRAMLAASGLPYIIENVDGAKGHLIDPILLCGSMFGLGAAGHQLQRHRWFESNIVIKPPGPCKHTSPVIGIYGGHIRCRSAKHGGRRTRDFEGHNKPALAREAMGMSWATMNQMSEAIPPAYTRFLGEQLIAHIQAKEASALSAPLALDGGSDMNRIDLCPPSLRSSGKRK